MYFQAKTKIQTTHWKGVAKCLRKRMSIRPTQQACVRTSR